MEFKKYLDVERLGKDEVEGILYGICHIFPKLDGTNASIWMDENGLIHGGSRNRDLTKSGKDNFDFATRWVKENTSKLEAFFLNNPHCRLYGEYLVPHTLKTYRETAWKKFYVFDVYDEAKDEYISYDVYKVWLDSIGLEYIPCVAKIENPSLEQLEKLRDNNTFLIEDGKGSGEGIVIKQYNWRNNFGHRVYGKLVRNEFTEENQKAFFTGKTNQGPSQHEIDLATIAVSKGRVDKILAKMKANGPWEDRRIPELLHRVYYEVIQEELWDYLKENKQVQLNFKVLQKICTEKTKQLIGIGR